MNFDNIINGIARPMIGFFMGMMLASTFQLAQSADWILGVIVGFGGVFLMPDGVLEWIIGE